VGFEFDRLGVRVPAIIVSAYTPQGTVLKTIFDHTSAPSTVVNCFGLPQGKLGKRQAKAPDVSEALALTAARQESPSITVPAAAQIGVARRAGALGKALAHAKAKPVSDLQKKILRGAAKRLGLSPAQQEVVEATETAHAQPLKFEAQLEMKRTRKRF
jgi:phospholipase C